MKNQLKNMCIITCMLLFTHLQAQERTSPENQSVELGKVHWYRDYDTALNLARKQGKSVLILFQEVPGCATCRNYGHDVLTHPLMVETIENEFIPLAIYNNKGGNDKKILTKYKEPSWNNPVVRIVDANGKDIIARIAGNYSAIALYKAMEAVLEKERKNIPEYMKLLGTELAAIKNNTIKETYFKMYCFWTGEKHLGEVNGVLATEAGFMAGHEVVKVKYDERLVDKKLLTQYAKNRDFTPIADNGKYRTATKDIQYYLQHTYYKFLPLTKLQKTKINSAIGNREPTEKYLSPKQLSWLKESKRIHPEKQQVLFNKDFTKVWYQKEALKRNAK